MVEQPNALLHKRDPQVLRRVEHSLVILAPCRCGDVADAGAGGTVDVVGEGELGGEGV